MIYKRSHKKNEKSKEKEFDLPRNLVEIYKLLEVNPKVSFVVKQLNKDKRIVARDIKRLIYRGYVKRIGRGIYEVIKIIEAKPQSHKKMINILIKKGKI